jgi:hypothetical protein
VTGYNAEIVMTIYDWATRFDSWRGEPAVWLLLATAVFTLLIPDARLAILGLAAQYFSLALLYLDIMDPRLAAIKLLVGWFVCLILALTGSQVRWGRLPPDVLPGEARNLTPPKTMQVRGRKMSITAVRALSALALLVFLWLLTLPEGTLLPLPEALAHLDLAIMGLIAFGLLGLSYTAEPLRAGIGVLMFLAGCELFYSTLEPTIASLLLLAAVNLLAALIVAFLTQKRYAAAAVLR